ncbi:MAG: hypothetical protein WD037_14735 [Balneolales bacterium]
MKNIIPYIIAILILSGFNISLLYINFDQQKNIDYLHSQIHFEQGLEFQGYSSVFYNSKIVHPEIELRDSGMSLLVFFTDRGCPSCLEYEIPNFAQFFNEHGQYTQAFLLSNNDSFTSRYEVNFPLNVISPTEGLLDTELDFDNPVAILTDSNGIIQHIYVAEVGNREKSDRFYERMTSLFQAVQ